MSEETADLYEYAPEAAAKLYEALRGLLDILAVEVSHWSGEQWASVQKALDALAKARPRQPSPAVASTRAAAGASEAPGGSSGGITRKVLAESLHRAAEDFRAFERRRKAEGQREAIIEKAWAVYEQWLESTGIDGPVVRRLNQLWELLQEHDLERVGRICEVVNQRAAAAQMTVAMMAPPVTPPSRRIGGSTK